MVVVVVKNDFFIKLHPWYVTISVLITWLLFVETVSRHIFYYRACHDVCMCMSVRTTEHLY